jgi:hypothetical protein
MDDLFLLAKLEGFRLAVELDKIVLPEGFPFRTAGIRAEGFVAIEKRSKDQQEKDGEMRFHICYQIEAIDCFGHRVFHEAY